ncbi:MAG: SAM-dependent methyltransferase [Planctomycetota bacterium]|jgi:SAM-dependent methyltransferase
MAPPATKQACLACKSVYNYAISRWDNMPLSVLGLPRSEIEARKMQGLVMDVRQCASCGHVFHTEFDYENIPYRTGSNLVYNEGASWKLYQDELATEWAEEYDLKDKRLVEIGCGEGLFLQRLARYGNHCIGFEPGPDAERARANGVEAYPEYFQGSRLYSLEADAIICRHVIEHLANPLDFLEDIAIACCEAGLTPLFFAEVPLIEKAMKQNRVNDFLYEHVSNFTLNSFQTMFERAGFEVLDVRPRFQDEVVTIVARPKPKPLQLAVRMQAARFKVSIAEQLVSVRETLTAWKNDGSRVALWGGTGKGAALINMFGIDASLVSTVIDSDARKTGGFVPGTGQEIRSPEYLADHPVDRILICTNWRARDIEREIREDCGIEVDLFVYLDGGLRQLTESTSL